MGTHARAASSRPFGPDHAKLDATTEADIRRQAIEDGEDPDADMPAETFVSPREVRRRYGMSQLQFAAFLGISVASLRNWEQARVTMEPSTVTLFRILAREPEAVRRVLMRREVA